MKSTACRLLLPLFVLGMAALPSLAQLPPDLFPVAGIEDRIEFWEKVFTQYGTDDLIIHDAQRVDLIYDVVNERERRSGVRRVEGLLNEVRIRDFVTRNAEPGRARPL